MGRTHLHLHLHLRPCPRLRLHWSHDEEMPGRAQTWNTHAALIEHLRSADQIRRTLSLASLDSLLVLSQNHGGERAKLIEELSRRGKGFVWRDEDEQRLFPRDSERAGVLAAKRGLRECDQLDRAMLDREYAGHELCWAGDQLDRAMLDKNMRARSYAGQELCRAGAILGRKQADSPIHQAHSSSPFPFVRG